MKKMMIKEQKKTEKREERKKNTYRKKERRSHKTSSPLLDLLLSPRPMVHKHYLCVWPSLGVCLSWTIRDHATTAATSKLHPDMLPVSTLRYAKVNKCSPNSSTHICLRENTT